MQDALLVVNDYDCQERAAAPVPADEIFAGHVFPTSNPTAYALIQGMAHLLPHFLYARDPWPADIVERVKHFRAGRWQRLWNERLKNAGKLRDKRARRE